MTAKNKNRISSRARRLSAGRSVDLEKWVLHVIPFWRRLPREMRVVLGVLSAYVDEEEAMDDLGIDAEVVRSHELYRDWKGVVDFFIEFNHFGARPEGGSTPRGGSVIKDVTANVVMGHLMFEQSFISGAKVLLGKGSAEDLRISKESGHTLSLLSEALRVEENLLDEDGAPGTGQNPGGTGLGSRD